MAKIPIILEAGRADGKLIKTNSIYDDNQEKFLSDKIEEIDNNHNTLNDTVNSLTNTVNNNKVDIENKLKTETTRANKAEDNLRTTINYITDVNQNSTTANIVTIATIPNSSASNVQQALNELFENITTDRIEDGAVTSEKIATSAFDDTLSVGGKIAPADVVGEKLTDLGTDVDKINKGEIVKPSNYTDGYKLNTSGELIADSESRVSEYIRWSGGTIAKVFRNTTTSGYLCAYDADKNFIDYWSFDTYRDINDALLAESSYLRFDFGTAAADVRLLDANDQVVWEPQDESQLNLFELANKVITTERIEDGAVTSEKIASSAFDSTLSVSGKIAPADVVGTEIGTLKVINIDNPFETSWQKTNAIVFAGIPYRFTCTVGRIAGQRIMDGDSILETLDVNIPAGEAKIITFTQSGELLFYCVNEGEVEVSFCNSTSIKEDISILNSTTSYLLNFFPHHTINSGGDMIPSLNVAVSELIKVDSNKNILVTTGVSQIAKYIILYNDSGYLDYYSVESGSSEREINTVNASYIQFGFSLKDINIVSVKDGENTIWAPKNNELIENKLKIIEENIIRNESIFGNYPNYIENTILNKLGRLDNHATFSTSQFINIAAAKKIKICYHILAESSMAALYDENKNLIDYFTLATNSTCREISAEGSSYVRFSFNKTGFIEDENGNILWQPIFISDEIKKNADKVNYIINYTPDTTISLNGDISGLKGMALSEYIPVHGDMSYLCTFGYNVKGAIVLYDANKQYYDYYTIALEQNQRGISMAGASYIRMPFNLSNIVDVKVSLDGEVVWKPNYYPDIVDKVEILWRKKGSRHTYDGEPIVLQALEYYTMFVNPYQGVIQDACCYQNTIFQFFLQEIYDNPACIVYDLITGEKIQEMDVPHGYYSHNNSAVFGSEKYDESDEFPLLYLSTLQRVAGQPTIDVFRITGTRGSYQCELVQTITIEKTEPYFREPTCFIDKQEKMLYATWITGEVDTFEKYPLPKLSDGNNIVIPASSKLDTYTISNRYPYGTTIGEPEQGGEIYNGKLYYAMGFKSCAWLIVIDLQKKEIVSSIDFTGIGLDYEPEGAFVWNGSLCVPFNESGKVVMFSFK